MILSNIRSCVTRGFHYSTFESGPNRSYVERTIFSLLLKVLTEELLPILQDGKEISVIIVTDDYL